MSEDKNKSLQEGIGMILVGLGRLGSAILDDETLAASIEQAKAELAAESGTPAKKEPEEKPKRERKQKAKEEPKKAKAKEPGPESEEDEPAGELDLQACREILHDVIGERGTEVAKEILGNFGVKKASDLTEDQFADFAEACREVLS